jgi:carboxylesterase type B
MVWIHGGGYLLGWKHLYGSPAGLFASANRTVTDPNDPSEDFIYV